LFPDELTTVAAVGWRATFTSIGVREQLNAIRVREMGNEFRAVKARQCRWVAPNPEVVLMCRSSGFAGHGRATAKQCVRSV
jgi:hypothetical protein